MYHIDKSKKPKKLSLFLSKPNKNRTTIGKLNHIYGEKLTVNFGQINELTFTIPYEVVIKNKLVRNPHIDKVREKYLIKAKFGESIEWFIITKINKSSNDSDNLTVQCFSLGYQLRYGKMINYEASSYNCLQVTEDCLEGTSWKVGYINPDFNLKYRQFDVSSKTKLEFLYEIAETFEGTVIFDTVKKEINIYKEEEVSQYKGFWVTYGKYLNTVDEDIDADEIVTRLHITGSDGLTINSVNPTGLSYIDDFSYFLYPFEMDENENVISSSNFMEDDLAIALVKYNQYVSRRKGEFAELLEEKKTQQQGLTDLQNQLTELTSELKIILDNIEVAKANGKSTSDLVKQQKAKNTDINNQKDAIKAIESEIKLIDEKIEILKKDLDITNHLSESQMDELSNFIHVEEWSDDNQIDVNELYEAGLKRISEINSPPVNIKANIVNFFEMVTESHNWDRLSVGDIVKIKHDKLNIWVQTKVSQMVFDFENVNIDITISNTKKLESDLDKIKRAFYTIGRVQTDYNNRKVDWNKIAKNFNLRNDRIKETPTNPTLNEVSIKHVENDNGSVNLTFSWGYPDYNMSNKNEDNIDGFFVYMYSSRTSEEYMFGSQMANETILTLDSTQRSYTFPSIPSNLYYTIGVRAYRSVDEDVNSDGIILSEIITPSNRYENPYLPSEDVNINGKLNGVNYTSDDHEPTNPEINEVWISKEDGKTRIWNGEDWVINTTINSKVDDNNYTKIEEGQMEHRGAFSRTSQGTTKVHDIRMMFENGYLRARNDTENRSAYFSDIGITTQIEGINPSGSLEFFSTVNSSSGKGVTLKSSGVTTIVANDGAIYLDSSTSINANAAIWTPSIVTTSTNGYFGMDGELRLVNKGYADGSIGTPFYRDLRANFLWADLLSTNASSNLYLGADGEIRATARSGYNGGNPIYRDFKAANVRGSSFITTSTNAYIGLDSELRLVNKGYADGSGGTVIYRSLRTLGVYGDFLDSNTSTGGTHVYIRPQSSSEAKITSIGTTDVFRPIRASNFIIDTSMRENKKDIEIYAEFTLDTFRNSNAYTYRRKNDTFDAFKQLGIMVDETPRILHGEAGDSIDLYATSAYLWRGLKEHIAVTDSHADEINWLKLENQSLRNRVSSLESQLGTA